MQKTSRKEGDSQDSQSDAFQQMKAAYDKRIKSMQENFDQQMNSYLCQVRSGMKCTHTVQLLSLCPSPEHCMLHTLKFHINNKNMNNMY